MADDVLDTACLRLFDAAARHRNLTRAANALGMTQPALSYRIRQIEDVLGVQLFQRRHRGLALTPEGEVLQRAVRQGLEQIDEAVQSIRHRARMPIVRLTTDFAFATFRLMPLMGRFRQEHPGVDVHIVATQSLSPVLENDAGLAVLFGSREEMESGARLLVPERVTTVCSPAFLERFGPFDHAGQLLNVPLIHLAGDSGSRWFVWESWLAAAGVSDHASASLISFNTYTLAIQAAQAGQGVALGWYGLVDDLLASGALVRACGLTLESGRGYWLQRKKNASPEAVLVEESIFRAFSAGDAAAPAQTW